MTNKKKYELTADVKLNVFGVKLFRIKALVSFGSIEAGELGGYIEKEENLKQSGDAWVSGNARVYGDAWVFGNAEVFGDAEVYGNARVSGDAEVYGNAEVSKKTHLLQIGFIGSRESIATFFRTKLNQISVSCGCFIGTVDEFETAVEHSHKGTKHEITYKLAIQLAKAQLELEGEETQNA